MPAPTSFDYAVLRVVPRVDREEFVNAGVILFNAEHRFLGARVHVDEARLKALWPALDVDLVRQLAGDVKVDGAAPVTALCDAASNADLVVLGSRGLRGLRTLGSVSERVAHKATCSVLTVR